MIIWELVEQGLNINRVYLGMLARIMGLRNT